jgi:hypothetical protein
MSCNSQKIRTLRQQIPSFECVPGCHDCCGPVTTSPEEMSRLPRKTRAEQDGRRPVELIHPRVEKQIHEYMASTRQVLV